MFSWIKRYNQSLQRIIQWHHSDDICLAIFFLLWQICWHLCKFWLWKWILKWYRATDSFIDVKDKDFYGLLIYWFNSLFHFTIDVKSGWWLLQLVNVNSRDFPSKNYKQYDLWHLQDIKILTSVIRVSRRKKCENDHN